VSTRVRSATMARMRIAILGLFPADPGSIVGGVEATTLRLSEGLSRVPGTDVHIVVSAPGRPVETASLAPNRTVHSVGTFDHFGNVLFAFPDRRRMVRALRRIEPDIVHAHSADRHALAAFDSGFPAVMSIHGVIEEETRLERRSVERIRGLFRNRMVGSALRRARNVIYVSPYLKDLYEAKLAHARRWVVENPVAPVFFETKGEEEPGRVLFAGLIILRKGLRNLLEAAAIARHEVPELRLVLAGAPTDTAYMKELRERSDALRISDRVFFLGGLSPEKLAEEYARAALVVLVSRQDTSPVCVQEAMAAGKPVIGSDVGGIPYLVREGETGFLVPYGEPELLARRITELVRDTGLRRRMGSEARKEAERRFSVMGAARATLDAYHEILSAPRASR